MGNENTSIFQKTFIVWICALACTALWGSAFPCIKVGYRLFEIAAADTASQILFAGLRFIGAGILALLIGSIGQKKILVPHKSSIPRILVLCVFQTSLQYLLFYISMVRITGVKASILQGTSVLFSLLIACLIFRTEKLTSLKMTGCIIGFLGVIVVNFADGGLNMEFTLPGEGFMILASLSSSFSAVLLKQFSRYENPVVLSGYQFLAGGAILTIIGLAFGGRLNGCTPASSALLLYMAFISAAAYSLWGILLKYNPVSRITVFMCTTEIFGVAFSALFLKETDTLGWQTAAALILVCAGIIMVNRKASSAEESD
ncbi:MAG: DMT family transporter [Clostridiales bacterium]|nr:DMT family transporter [Clostridiales bacterium]